MASIFGVKLVRTMLLLILLTFSAVPRASASLYRGEEGNWFLDYHGQNRKLLMKCNKGCLASWKLGIFQNLRRGQPPPPRYNPTTKPLFVKPPPPPRSRT